MIKRAIIMKILKHVAFTFTLIWIAVVLSCGSENRSNLDPSKRQSAQLTPLSDVAFRALLSVPNPPARMRPGQKQVVQVNVKNISPNDWPALGAEDARFAITLRNRWLSSDEKKVINDTDGGASLPYDLMPASATNMNITITAPAEPGEYVLEFDMVQERITWFRDKGSQPTRLKVKVEP
jgi:hypothetical protein